MSLINDALKRASEAKPPPDAEVNAPALRPVEDRPRSVWVWVWCAAGLMFAAFLASWAIVMGLIVDHHLKAKQVSAREIKTQTNPVSVEPESAGARGLQSIPLNLATNADKVVRAVVQAAPEEQAVANPNREQGVNTATNAVAPVAVEPPKPAAPVLKLQGILWKPSKPLAMINSKLVGPGGKILNAKVVAIDQESVTLEQAGQTVVLTLP